MGLYSLKGKKDHSLSCVVVVAHKLGFTPNIVTAIGLCFGVTGGALIAVHEIPLALSCVIISVFCDALDGAIARRFDEVTTFGLFFDSISDRISEIALVLGAFFCGLINIVGLIAIVGSLALLLFRTLSYWKNLSTDFAFFGRFERLFFILIGIISPYATFSTFCFVIAGGFGLVSSIQILITMSRQNVSLEKSSPYLNA